MRFRSTFQRFVSQIEWSLHWKVLRKRIRKGWLFIRTSSFGDSMTMTMGSINSRVICNDECAEMTMKLPTTLLSLHLPLIFCNHLANFIPPKRRLWKAEQKMQCGFSKHFSWAWVLDFGLLSRENHSKTRISSFVHRAHLPLNSSRVTSVTRRAFVADATHRFRRFYRGAATSWYHDDVSFHVGNNISAKYPRRICK